MIINKDSWHYKAWRWTYDRDWQVPADTNFCSYMRRIMFLVPIKGIIRGVLLAFAMFCLALVAGIRWIFGYKTVSADLDESPVEYAGLPVAGRQIYPWHILLPAGVIGLEALLQHSCGWIGFAIINGFLLGGLVLVTLAAWFFHSDSTEIFRDWVWAQKRKICPLIEFGDHYDAQHPDDDANLGLEEGEDFCDCPLCSEDEEEADEDEEEAKAEDAEPAHEEPVNMPAVPVETPKPAETVPAEPNTSSEAK